MAAKKQTSMSIEGDAADEPVVSSGEEDGSEKKPSQAEKKKKEVPPWYVFLENANDYQVKKRFSTEIQLIIDKYESIKNKYAIVTLFDPESSIGTFDLDKIFSALKRINNEKDKDVLLVLLSPGGSIEPAYQISKLCKSFSKRRFIVTVPRFAKSAATLIAIGADEIHMGQLGHLGPIDPQLGGLPALGVTQALESIASLSEKFPGSSEMFARYLRLALTVEQIGYCERISESAAQYAERLLTTKPSLSGRKAKAIARELVHEYKDHGFVIDRDEARDHLGDSWIISESEEIALSEEIYSLFEEVNLMLDLVKDKRLLIIGTFDNDVLVFNKRKSS